MNQITLTLTLSRRTGRGDQSASPRRATPYGSSSRHGSPGGFSVPLSLIPRAWFCGAASPANEALPIPLRVSAYAASLLASCMVCHGELYRLRPPPWRLTAFYLLIAAGGALGG